MYSIYMFDGLLLPELIDQGGGNDIGTGDALTSFTQLPGGGFVDNYGQRVSPQNIRPITRDCILFGNTPDELYANFTALRGKIGKRGRLSVRFDSGQIWWQWARLQRVSTPRNLEARTKWLACGLTFVTAAQHWYGTVQTAEGWEVGDDSFYLGDGSAELGMQHHVFDAPFPGASVSGSVQATLTTNGNTYVRNMRVEMQLDQHINNISLRMIGTGHAVGWTNPTIAGGWTLQIDTGEKSCRVRHDTEGKTIGFIVNLGARLQVATTVDHGRSTGDSVEIAGTTSFNGVYHNIVVGGAQEFYVDKLPETVAPSQENGGAVYWLQDTWANLGVYDRTNWLLMAPGNNQFFFAYATDGSLTQIQDYQISFSFYDHYF